MANRIKHSVGGAFIGLIMTIAAGTLLFWNEGRAVHTEKGLKEGAGIVLSVNSEKVDPSNEAKLVHMSGPLKTGGPVADDTFLVQSPNGIRLERVVEMYQWKEKSETRTEKTPSGGEAQVTVHTYDKVWSPELINSGQFAQGDGHQNPSAMPHTAASFNAPDVKLNAYRMSLDLLDQLSDPENLPLSDADLQRMPEALKNRVKLLDNQFYFSANPMSPQIGDTRVSFKVVMPSVVSLVSQQQKDSFKPYETKQGTTINLISRGAKSAPEMFQEAITANRTLTWILRVLGFFMMCGGLRLIFGPLTALAGSIPFFGSIVNAGIGLIACLLGFALSFGTMAVAWIFYRPLLGIALLVMGAGLLVAVGSLIVKHRPKTAPA